MGSVTYYREMKSAWMHGARGPVSHLWKLSSNLQRIVVRYVQIKKPTTKGSEWPYWTSKCQELMANNWNSLWPERERRVEVPKTDQQFLCLHSMYLSHPHQGRCLLQIHFCRGPNGIYKIRTAKFASFRDASFIKYKQNWQLSFINCHLLALKRCMKLNYILETLQITLTLTFCKSFWAYMTWKNT